MGFLDKLLGRGKDAAETTGDTAKDMGGKAADTAERRRTEGGRHVRRDEGPRHR